MAAQWSGENKLPPTVLRWCRRCADKAPRHGSSSPLYSGAVHLLRGSGTWCSSVAVAIFGPWRGKKMDPEGPKGPCRHSGNQTSSLWGPSRSVSVWIMDMGSS